MIKILCDRCGGEICDDSKRGHVSVCFGEGGDGFETSKQLNKMDFCETCIHEIVGFIERKSCNRDESSMNRGDETEKKRVKKIERKDYGKIKALHDAGWTQTAIGEEMGTSQNAISVALRVYDAKVKSGYSWDPETLSFFK